LARIQLPQEEKALKEVLEGKDREKYET